MSPRPPATNAPDALAAHAGSTMGPTPQPLRVLHLTAASDAGGISRYLLDLTGAMRAMGHTCVIAGEHGAWHDRFIQAGCPWIDAPLKHGVLGLFRSTRILADWLAQHPVDLLHCHYRLTSLIARRLQRRFNLPILFTLHLTGISVRGPRRWLTDLGDVTHVASQQARQWVLDQRLAPDRQIVVIPHGIDPHRFPLCDEPTRLQARHKLHLPADARIGAYVGRFDTPKNEEWLLDVADHGRNVGDIHIILMGEGPHEASLRADVQRRGLADRVHILPTGDPLPVYQACDAVLLPSAREGFSLMCAEAMSVGRPVLRTDTAGAAEQIIENVTGRAVPVEHDAFVTAAVQMLTDTDALRRMGPAAAAHVRDRLTWQRQLTATLQLYHDLRDRRFGSTPPRPPTAATDQQE